jgi:hypothetical protein
MEANSGGGGLGDLCAVEVRCFRSYKIDYTRESADFAPFEYTRGT